jgi:hypothetical protein
MKDSFDLTQRWTQSKQVLRIPSAKGFALPMAMALGLVMLAIAGTTVMVAQSSRDTAVQRRATGGSMLIGDSAIARALVQLNQPNNGVLLNRNYDPINPETGKNYLGPDGVPDSGDETGTAVDQWTGYNPSDKPCFEQLEWNAPNIPLTGTLETGSTYTIQAYHYDKEQQLGTLLVTGNYQGQVSNVAVTLSIEPILDDFPGIALINPTTTETIDSPGVIALRGRQVLGTKGNIYYMPNNSADPSLTGISAPGESTRPSYLNAIRSSDAQDGAKGDTVSGKLFACRLHPQIPSGVTGTNLGVITKSKTLTGAGGEKPTLYQAQKIDLSGSDVLTVDTTDGPVHIDLLAHASGEGILLKDKAKILNVRTDGEAPQVGDLRIMSRVDSRVRLQDKTCIQDAFLWFFLDEMRLLTSGPGCPSGRNTNIEGVVWMEAIFSAKNASSNRTVGYLGNSGLTQDYNTPPIPGTTSGIAVPDDVTSLVDLLEYVDWPVKYKYGEIKDWKRFG